MSTATGDGNGWTDADVAELLGGMEVETSPPGSAPHTAMIARHLNEAVPIPLARVETAFGDWGLNGLFPPEPPHRPGPDVDSEPATVEVVKSVIALTRFVPQDEHRRGKEMTHGDLQRTLFEGLVHLNAILEPIGFVAGRWEIGALTLADVSPEVAIMVHSTGTSPGEMGQMMVLVTPVHNGYPVLASDVADDGSIAHEAIGYHGPAAEGGQPLLEVFRFIHAAERGRLIGDFTRALVNLNTAIELLIRLVLFYGNSMLDTPEKDAIKAVRAPLKQKVDKFLPELIGREIDREDPGSPWGAWFGDGYLLRNRAVHEGELMGYDEVDRAFDQAGALIADLRESLLARARLKRLGEWIEMEARPREERVSDDLLDIEFPWESEE